MLGTARSQAPADSIFTLVDRLTLEILRLILSGEARELPRIDLARISTGSLPALKSYLEGEVFFRRSQFQSAAEAYARAVDADSNFVLARYRLGLSRWWVGGPPTVPDPFDAEVGPVADRLPPHEAAIFRASRLRAQDVRAARELLEREARRNPDDAETWHELGELYHHSGAQALAPPEAADRAFARAIELDSTFTLPYIHRIDHAISAGTRPAPPDCSARSARLAPESPYVARYRLVTGLALGDPAAHSRAEAALDTLNTHDLIWLGDQLQGQRCCWELAERVLRKARERGDELRPNATRELFWVSLAQGKAREALGWVADPFMPEEHRSRMLYVLDELGVPVPDARLDAALTLDPADSADAVRLFYVGSYAASRARGRCCGVCWSGCSPSSSVTAPRGIRPKPASQRQCGRHSKDTRRGAEDGETTLCDCSSARNRGSSAIGRGGSSTLASAGGSAGCSWRWAGLEQALLYFETLTSSSLPADYERGRIYDQLGEFDRAREAYALFLAPRQQADPVFQPMIHNARAALQRLAVAALE